MSKAMGRRAIMRKTVQIGLLTALSRFMAIGRAFLQLDYLGFTGMSDAFVIAYRIPNFLRKIFAEGALSAAFVPVFVRLMRNNERSKADSLMLGAFILFEGVLGIMLLLVLWQPAWIVSVLAPGFSTAQMSAAVPLTRILFPFIICVSSGALLAGALQAVNHFSVAAFGPVLLNFVYLIGLLVCMYVGLSPIALAWFILVGGVIHLIMHWWVYRSFAFRFGRLTRQTWPLIKEVLGKFGPTLLGMSVVELNMVLDGRFGSYLQTGSVTMLHYGNRFMGIPLGVFGVAFATVLLSHFSRTSLYARSRFGYYLLEAAKLIIWLMLPAVLLIWHLAEPTFTSFLVGKASAADIAVAANVLRVYALGLIFFCLNKVLMNVAYSLHDLRTPTVAAIGATLLNIMGNMIAVHYHSRVGIAFSTVISTGLFVTICLLSMLSLRHNIRVYTGRLLSSLPRIVTHGVVVVAGYLIVEKMMLLLFLPFLSTYLPAHGAYWLVALPLMTGAVIVLYTSRKIWQQKLYFAA